MRNWHSCLLTTTLALLLMACLPKQEVSTTKVPTLEPSVVPSATPTATRTSVPATLTPTLTATPTQPVITPVPPDDLFSTFLFQGANRDCELACWRGLTVGESDLEDVEAVLDQDFGLFLPVKPYGGSQPDVISLGHHWLVGDTSEYFGISFLIKTNSHKLQFMQFVSSTSLTPTMTPQSVIKELGKPDYWKYSMSGALGVSVTSYMAYQDGIVIIHLGQIYVEGGDATRGSSTAELCLDREDLALIVDIVPPFEQWPPETSPFITEFDPDLPTTTIDEITGYSINTIVDIAQNASHPCIKFKY